MTFVAGAVIWSGYLLGWWGWLAMTDRVQPGQPESFWWPSIKDLIVPGRINFAVPPKLLKDSSSSSVKAPVITPEQAVEKGVGGVEITGGGA